MKDVQIYSINLSVMLDWLTAVTMSFGHGIYSLPAGLWKVYELSSKGVTPGKQMPRGFYINRGHPCTQGIRRERERKRGRETGKWLNALGTGNSNGKRICRGLSGTRKIDGQHRFSLCHVVVLTNRPVKNHMVVNTSMMSLPEVVVKSCGLFYLTGGSSVPSIFLKILQVCSL